MRILQIVSSTSKSGGVMNFLINYNRVLYRRNIYFDYLYFYDVENNFNEEIKEMGGNCYNIGIPKLSFKFLKKVSDFFKTNNDYVAIHCHPIFSFFIFGHIAKKNKIKHIIQHSHTTSFSNKKKSAIRNKLIMKFAPLLVTEYVACSEDAIVCLPQKDLKKKRNIVINDAFDINSFKYNEEDRNAIRNELNIDKESIVIGNVGRFSSEKNHKFILEVFKKYHEKNSNSYLILCGIGNLENEIISYAKKLNIYDNIKFLGVRTDINKILSSLDFFLFPSKFEGLGIAAIEAQANGLITFCSSKVPQVSCITNETLRFDLEDKDSQDYIVNKMLTAKDLNHKDNFELIKNAGFDIFSESKKLEDFYNSLK